MLYWRWEVYPNFLLEDLRTYHAHQYTRLLFNPYPRWAFTMGTIPTGLRKTDPEEPQRSVLLDAYAIGAYQVTNAQYVQFVEETGTRNLCSGTRRISTRPIFRSSV